MPLKEQPALGAGVAQLSDIRENKVSLRLVDRESEGYHGLVDSIRLQGFTSSITVRPVHDSEQGCWFYEIVDGLHRFCAARDAGCTEVPVVVVDKKDDDVLILQILQNVHRIETKPVEYSRQLRRVLDRNPMMTEAELATQLGKSPKWIADRLGLNRIADTNIKTLIDEGRVPLANAYSLAKLTPEDQAQFLDAAISQSPLEFGPAVANRLREVKSNIRQGKDTPDVEFKPIAHLRRFTEIKEELGIPDTTPRTGAVRNSMITENMTPFQAAEEILRWVCNVDQASIDVQKARIEARKKKKEEERAKIQAEQASKKVVAMEKKQEEAAKIAEVTKMRVEGKITEEESVKRIADIKAAYKPKAEAKAEAKA